MEDPGDFYLLPLKDTEYEKVRPEDVLKKPLPDSDIKNNILTRDEGEVLTSVKSVGDNELPE